MIRSTSLLCFALACLIALGCGSTMSSSMGSPPAPPAESAPAAAPSVPLAATPADRLGSAPGGFGLAAGSRAPDGTLPDVTGAPQQLSALYAAGPVFVVFYRGGWCPFCNVQLHQLGKAMPEFRKAGLQIVAISVDVPGEEARTQAANGVPFAMLSDSDLTVHKAFQVVHVPPEAEAKALAGYGVDLQKYSGQRHGSFAVPAIFLIDRTGAVRWQHIDEDYKTRPTPAQLLEVARRTIAP